MTDPKPVTSDAFAALQASFKKQSQKAQAYYTAMHAIGKVLKSEDAASAWMEQSVAALGGKTPAELIGEGREDEVLGHIRTLGT